MPRGRKEIGVFNTLRTPERRREIAVKAGKASAAKRAKRKSIREKWEDLVASIPPKELCKTFKTKIGKTPEDWDEAMMMSCLAEVLKGNVKALELIYRIRGELTDKMEVNVNPFEALLKSLPEK